MSWSTDIDEMHAKFKVHEWTDNAITLQKQQLMKLRMRMLAEEFNETLNAYLSSDEEELIDGLIDLCVISIGTLDICNVDAQYAWKEVMRANMAKEVGIKPGRPNPLGLPDLVKPSGWSAPSHCDNHGNMKDYL